jgi:hypothetical protein
MWREADCVGGISVRGQREMEGEMEGEGGGVCEGKRIV